MRLHLYVRKGLPGMRIHLCINAVFPLHPHTRMHPSRVHKPPTRAHAPKHSGKQIAPKFPKLVQNSRKLVQNSRKWQKCVQKLLEFRTKI